MANYLLDYRGFKAIFEAANEEVDAMIAAAKASDKGTEVPQKPAYTPLFLWFADNAVKGADNPKNDAQMVKQSITYWSGSAGTITGDNSSGSKLDKAIEELEFFTDVEKVSYWIAAVSESSGISNSPTTGRPKVKTNDPGITPNPDFLDASKLATAVTPLLNKLKELKREGWEFNPEPGKGNVYLVNYKDPAKNPEKKKLLNYIPRLEPWFEYTTAKDWKKAGQNGTVQFNLFYAWYFEIMTNGSKMIEELQSLREPIFVRKGVPMKLEDKIKILDIIQETAEKYLNWDKAKYDTTADAIQNAYSIKISRVNNGVTKTDKTTVVSEPTKTENTVVVYKSIADDVQAKGMFQNNLATFAPGFTETLINAVVSSINDVKTTEGFSKFTSITIKPVASTNVIPTTFSYKGKTGNDALALARLDALATQIINPALEQIPDIKPLAKIDMVKGLAPNNSNETSHPGSSKWVKGGNVDDPKYAEFRYSTVIIDITYETTLSSTTPGETIESSEYVGEWAVNIMIPKPSSGGSSTPGGQQYKRVPKRWLNKRSPDTVPSCKEVCHAYRTGG